MGQAYVIANLDKGEFLYPFQFGDHSKLLDFGDSSGGAMTGLAILLASGNGRGGGDLHSQNPIIGTWAGDRIVIAGDYADSGLFGIGEDSPHNLYHIICHGFNDGLPKGRKKWRDISRKVIMAMKDD